MSEEIEIRKPQRSSTMIVGAVIGAIAGIIAAAMLYKRAERNQHERALTASDGVKIGVLIFGLLRAIASISDND